MKILVTGHAGFIGFHVANALLGRGDSVIGVDNVNDYYSPELKQARLNQLGTEADRLGADYCSIRTDLIDRVAMEQVFRRHRPQRVIHLAAQAGVRYAAENPHVYVASNVTGFLHVLEGCRRHGVEHLVYASTSSVYGANTTMPFSVHRGTEHPLTLYAATKKANEMMAHSYAHLYGIPCTGLRFFTVYGPWGRPDMALFKFTKAILAGEPIPVFNHGHHQRDFTYIDDIVEGVIRTLDHVAAPDPDWSGERPDPAASAAPYRLYNIGNQRPVQLLRYIELLEDCLGRKAEKQLLPLQPGDVPDTWADVDDLARDVGYRPRIPVETGIARFVDWYLDYYKSAS